MSIRRSLRYALATPGAAGKLFKGGGLTALFLTVFFAFVVMGYLMRILCNLLEGRRSAMPHFRDFRGLFNDGLQPVLIGLVYVSPVIALSIAGRYVHSTTLLVLQLVVALSASLLFPLGLIHSVTQGRIQGAFQIPIIYQFLTANLSRVLSAWLTVLGVMLLTVFIAGVVSVAIAVPVSVALDTGVGAVVGFAVGLVVLLFISFAATVLSIHVWADAYRASAPFADDTEGRIRAAVVVPPSLDGGR